MMFTDRIVTDCGRQEICGNHFGPLMDQLIKGMLAICPRLSPDNGATLIIDPLTISIYRFPVTLHISLLKICGEPVHVLVIG